MQTFLKKISRFRWAAWVAVLGLLSYSAFAQSSQRFPAPLGLDRVLTGVVSKVKTKQMTKSSSKAAKYALTVEGKTFQLHGHDSELKKLCGKKVRLTGHTVGSDVTVATVAPAAE